MNGVPARLFPQDERERLMTEASIQVVYTDPGGEGNHRVFHTARLAAELLNGKLVVVQPGYPAAIDKLSGIFSRAKDRVRLTSTLPFRYVISI
jgi:hypothetical protein